MVKGASGFLIAAVVLSAFLLAGAASAWEGSLQLSRDGNTVTITGSTNLAPGNRILVNVVSAAFTPTEKGAGGGFAGASGTVEVRPGTPLNFYRFEMDVSAFPPGLYLVTAESLETGYRDSAQFILPWAPVPTAVPATPATSPPTIPATPTILETGTPSPQASPAMPLPGLVAPVALSITVLMILRLRGNGFLPGRGRGKGDPPCSTKYLPYENDDSPRLSGRRDR